MRGEGGRREEAERECVAGGGGTAHQSRCARNDLPVFFFSGAKRICQQVL